MSNQLPFTRQIESFYTDGACIGNPGPGGWGVVTYFTDGSVFEMGGAEPQTTNNRMEIQGAITALTLFKQTQQTKPITLYTDSEYLIKGITQWIRGWKKKNWKTSQGKKVVNQDLWQVLDTLNSDQVQWEHVRGHSGNEGNERCDTIAREFAQGGSPNLQQPFSLDLELSSEQIYSPAVTGLSDLPSHNTISYKPSTSLPETAMIDSSTSIIDDLQLPREVRVTQLRGLIETLRIADEIAKEGYLISSSELADLMDINASAVTSRGDHWPWRNWVVSRVRREGNQILWQLERID